MISILFFFKVFNCSNNHHFNSIIYFYKPTLKLLRDFYYAITTPSTDKVKEKATKSTKQCYTGGKGSPHSQSQKRQPRLQVLSHWSVPSIQELLVGFFPQGELSEKLLRCCSLEQSHGFHHLPLFIFLNVAF